MLVKKGGESKCTLTPTRLKDIAIGKKSLPGTT